ncbi:MAG: histidinol-phosphatase [Planctomycetia bacterium]|jgi:histidinol phosphatase-like enzyme (inositol monophosphatase family)
MSNEIDTRLKLAVTIAEEAGRITLEYFAQPDLKVERKKDDSPVTVADRRAEEHLRRRIAEAFPDDGILGEEFDDVPGRNPWRWILDPIDGTKSFIHGVPLYSTLVAVQYEEKSVLGVIRIPAMAECVYAADDRGAWYVRGDAAPAPARVSTTPTLAESLFVTSEVITFDEVDRRAAYERLEKAARLTRTWGDAYGYLMVATGRADVMVDPVVEEWDVAAMLPILREAGGVFTDWNGVETTHSRQGVATNRLLLDEVLMLL